MACNEVDRLKGHTVQSSIHREVEWRVYFESVTRKVASLLLNRRAGCQLLWLSMRAVYPGLYVTSKTASPNDQSEQRME